MKYAQAKQFLKPGMLVRLKYTVGCGHAGKVGKVGSDCSSISDASNSWAHVFFGNEGDEDQDEIEILSNPDDTWWSDPSQEPFSPRIFNFDRIMQDSIKLTQKSNNLSYSVPYNAIAKEYLGVKHALSSLKFFDGDKIDVNYFYPKFYFGHSLSELRPERKTLMNKLSDLAASIRRAFSPDQKALWQAGYIDSQGEWAPKAMIMAIDCLQKEWLDAHQDEIVGYAKEEIEAEKE